MCIRNNSGAKTQGITTYWSNGLSSLDRRDKHGKHLRETARDGSQ
jgi:hypothetical protein